MPTRFAILALALIACKDAQPPDVDAPSASFTCDPSAEPAELPLRRLTATQVRGHHRALLAEWLPAFPEAQAALTPALDALVADVPQGPDAHFARLSRLDQAVSQAHVERAYSAARAFGAVATAGPRLAALADGCDAQTRACVERFVRTRGEAALRRAISEDDVAFYTRPIAGAAVTADDWADVLTLLLAAPEAMYLVERTTDNGQLDAWSLASRLSFHAWQATPDAELRALAASDALRDPETYAAQVDRVFNDPRATDAVADFFAQWLYNPALEPMDARVGGAQYDAMLNGFTPTATLHAEMAADVRHSAAYAWTQGHPFDRFLDSPYAFATSPELAQIYGVPVWDGDSNQPAMSEPPVMSEPQRAGLITRAGLVANGSANTRPIMKGVLLRVALLCDIVPPPPDNVAGDADSPPADASTRAFVEQLTGSLACASCHQGLINPLGFATEDFDPIGRYRATQPLYDPQTGASLGEVAINTVVNPQIDSKDEQAADAHDLTALLIASPKPRACLTRQWFRHSFGRLEDPSRDGCALAEVDSALTAGRSMREALQRIAHTPAFRTRLTDGGTP